MPLKVHELLASVDAAVEESELRKKKARQQPKQRNVFDINFHNIYGSFLIRSTIASILSHVFFSGNHEKKQNVG